MKHIEKHHNIKMPKHNKNILAFKILTLNKNTKQQIYNDYQIITLKIYQKTFLWKTFIMIFTLKLYLLKVILEIVKKIYRKINIESPTLSTIKFYFVTV